MAILAIENLEKNYGGRKVVNDVSMSVESGVVVGLLGPNGAGKTCLLNCINRFYQPDIDIENLEVFPNLLLSTPQEMRLPLRWLAILYGRVAPDLAATTAVYTAEDVIKLMMSGANVTMLCSALLRHGNKRITEILSDLQVWMEEHEYDSINLMRGSMSQKACPEPAAFERANYMKALNNYV